MSLNLKDRRLLLLALGAGVAVLILVVAVTPVGDALFDTNEASDSSDGSSGSDGDGLSGSSTEKVEVTEGGVLAPGDSASDTGGEPSGDPSGDPAGPAVAGEEEVPVVPDGDPLPLLQIAPPDTIAMLDPSVAAAGSAYAVTFETYGITNEPDSLVIFVSKSSALGGGRGYDFEETNVLVYVKDGTLPDTGGTYEGTLTLVDEGGLLVPRLSDIE